MRLQDYLHLYLGCRVMTPDGEATLVGLPYTVVGRDRVRVHFGKMVHTKNSIDGGYKAVRNHGDYAINECVYEAISGEDMFTMPGGVTPILRPLSDMTEEEFREIFNPIQPKDVADEDFKDAMESLIENGIDAFDFDGVSAVYVFELTRKLLSKHFDLFGLIEAGLAVKSKG